MITSHELDAPTAQAVTQDRPVQVLLDSPNTQIISLGPSSEFDLQSVSGARKRPHPSHMVALHCNICSKDFSSQRDFTNHRRRKDFCKPLIVTPPVREIPKKIRRIGIIRREIIR